MATEEQVLVVPRKIIEQVGMFNGLRFDVDSYLDKIFQKGTPQFMPRSLAEVSPEYKQLIPYVIMSYNGTYLSYVRGKRAGETRLVGNRSIGIGGHINPPDQMPLFDTSFLPTYLTAVQREVEEEVVVETDHTNHIVALLNDESNEVGSVHLGVVHFWSLNSPDVTKREQMITQMNFMSADELKAAKDTLETWSAICVEGIDQIENNLDQAKKI